MFTIELSSNAAALLSKVADRGVKVTLVVPGYVKTNLSLNAVTGNGGTYAKMDETTAKVKASFWCM